jgi:hypothetical protein
MAFFGRGIINRPAVSTLIMHRAIIDGDVSIRLNATDAIVLYQGVELTRCQACRESLHSCTVLIGDFYACDAN